MRIEACGRCGGPLVGDWCAACSAAVLARFVHREIVILLLLCGIGVAAFVLTRAAAAAHHHVRVQDAETWYERGEADLADGRLTAAVEALRRAALIRRDEPRYRLSLARALGADGQDEAARQALLGLREERPEAPEINLLLARLEARRQDVTAAVRYYQNALYGSWGADQLDAREEVRLELVNYLLEHGLEDRALAELLIIAADLPDDPARRVSIGELFLASGDSRRALEQFQQALRVDPSHGAALAGAGRAAAARGDFTAAQRYLRRAPTEAGVEALRATVRHVLANDPLAPRLTRAERRRRAVAAATWAARQLAACGPGVEAQALRDRIAKTPLRDAATAAEDAVALLHRVARDAPEGCRESGPETDGWLTIARRHPDDPA